MLSLEISRSLDVRRRYEVFVPVDVHRETKRGDAVEFAVESWFWKVPGLQQAEASGPEGHRPTPKSLWSI